MEILKNLLSIFKEILYDIFSYLIPGLFLLFILCFPSIIGKHYSFMYALYEILFNSNVKFNMNFINLFHHLSCLKILCILFLSYLIGHLPIYISLYLKKTAKFLSLKFKISLSKSNSCNDYKDFCNNILEVLKVKTRFREDLFKDNQGDYNQKFFTTFASTYSRFTSHNDLIQKYICKINFYNSISCIFFILFIDSIISCFCWKGLNPLSNIYFLDFKMLLIILFLFICFLTFLFHYNKHNDLKQKECFLFLYEYFN